MRVLGDAPGYGDAAWRRAQRRPGSGWPASGLPVGAARPELDPGQDGDGHQQPRGEQRVHGEARPRTLVACGHGSRSGSGPRPSRPLGPELNVRAGCGACAGGSMCGRALAPRSAKPGSRSSRPLLVPSGPGRPSRRRRLTAVPGRRSPRRRPGVLSPAVLRLAQTCPPPAGHRDGRLSRRCGYVLYPCPRRLRRPLARPG